MTPEEVKEELGRRLVARLQADELGDGVLAASMQFLKTFPPKQDEETIASDDVSVDLARYRSILRPKAMG